MPTRCKVLIIGRWLTGHHRYPVVPFQQSPALFVPSDLIRTRLTLAAAWKNPHNSRMRRTTPKNLFRDLLSDMPRGSPLSTAWLQERGLTAKQVARLAADGWLQRLGRGLYLLPGDVLSREASLAQLAKTLPGLHVAGKSALSLRGIRHNLPFKEHLILWGEAPGTVPDWFTASFPASYQATHLFDATLAPSTGIAPLPSGHPDVWVSTPERALLELLSDVGKGQGLEEARHLVEAARTLRVPVLDELLAHLQRIKVVRLASTMAQELGLPWADLARRHSARMGGGARWVSASPAGERLNLKRPL